MSDFYKRFLLEEVPKVIPGSAKQVFLAAFGKHPGWDDHVEDLGLDTGSLITAKMLLYVKGIGGEIDAGAWEKLDDSQRLPGFKHIFVWQRSRQVLVGRMWASTDGKGRARYPMVVCAHCVGVPLSFALEQVLPVLEQLEQTCVTTTSAAEVRSALDRARSELRDAVSRSPDTATVANGPLLRDQFVNSSQFGPDRVGLLRILYQMSSQFAPFASGRFNARADASTLRPQHLRTPWGTSSADQAVLLWSQLLQTQVDGNSPVLIQVPLQESWLDITVGELTREEMFCLRATPKAVPLTSEVPYNLEESFRQSSQVVLDEFVQGRRTSSAGKSQPLSETVPPAPKSGSGVGKLWKWLGGAGVIIVIAAAALLMIPSGEKQTAQTGAPPKPASTKPAPPTSLPAQETKPAPVQPPPTATPAPNAALTANNAQAEEVKADAARAAAMKAQEVERARQARELELKRIAEEKAHAEAVRKSQEEKAAALREAEKHKADMEAEKARQIAAAAALVAPVTPTPAPAPSVPTQVVTTASAKSEALPPGSFTNSIGMIFVRLTAGYWVSQTEVTEAQFKKIAGPNESVSALGANYPVHLVSWNEALEFCRKLTAEERQSSWLQKGWAYSLPSEAQWAEFVGNAVLEDSVTSFRTTKRTRPEPVASARPNRFSLFDVRGNVWEWCFSTNQQKMARGGAFNGVTERTLGIEATWPLGPDGRREDIGFRCVMVPER